MYTKYDIDIADAYKSMFGKGKKVVTESEEDEIGDVDTGAEDDTGVEDAATGAEEEVPEDPLDIAIAEYEAAAQAAEEQEDEEGAAKNTQLADWLKELKEFKAAAEGDEEGTEEIEDDEIKVTESAPCCKKVKITKVEPKGQKIK
jgi:hypothetical protein